VEVRKIGNVLHVLAEEAKIACDGQFAEVLWAEKRDPVIKSILTRNHLTD
jgi:hypothetical protein